VQRHLQASKGVASEKNRITLDEGLSLRSSPTGS